MFHVYIWETSACMLFNYTTVWYVSQAYVDMTIERRGGVNASESLFQHSQIASRQKVSLSSCLNLMQSISRACLLFSLGWHGGGTPGEELIQFHSPEIGQTPQVQYHLYSTLQTSIFSNNNKKQNLKIQTKRGPSLTKRNPFVPTDQYLKELS